MLVLCAIAVVVAGLLVSPSAVATDSSCPSRSTSLARTSQVAVVRRPTRGVVACERRRATVAVLTEEYFERLFTGPALAIKGRRVAYAIVNFEDPDEALEDTSVFQLDFARRDADGAVQPPAAYFAGPVGASLRVTRLLLRSDGAMAWLACESRFSPPPARVERGGECSRPGGRRVYVVTVSAGVRKIVTAGRDIDPQYLRFGKAGRIVWRAGGRARTARLDG